MSDNEKTEGKREREKIRKNRTQKLTLCLIRRSSSDSSEVGSSTAAAAATSFLESLRALAAAEGASASVDRALAAVRMDEEEEEKGRGRVEAEAEVASRRRAIDIGGVDSAPETLAATTTTAARRPEAKDATMLLLLLVDDERAPRARPRRPEAATPGRIPATTAAELLKDADGDCCCC